LKLFLIERKIKIKLEDATEGENDYVINQYKQEQEKLEVKKYI